MNETERALKKSLVMICGQEDLLRSRTLTRLLVGVPIAADDFDVQVFDAPGSSAASWVGSATTAPFLADRRVVIVRHLLQSDPPAEAVDFAKIDSNGLLILVADSVGGTEERRSKAAKTQANWETLVNGCGGVVLRYDSDPKVAKQSMKAEASAAGVAISDRALDALVEITGGSFSRAYEEFAKLRLFVGANETISERHVEAIAVPSREWNVFKLTDAIVENRPSEALNQLKTLLGTTAKAEDAAFSQILPQISRNLKLLWQAKISLELGESLQSPSPRLKSMFPKRPNLASEQPYRQARFVKMARPLTLAGLGRAFQVIADADARLKGSLAGFNSVDTLETMVLELSSELSGKKN